MLSLYYLGVKRLLRMLEAAGWNPVRNGVVYFSLSRESSKNKLPAFEILENCLARQKSRGR